MKKRIWCIVLFCMTTLSALADMDVRVKHLSVSNGLTSNHVRSIVQDSKGYIWMGTTNGLIRYDGYKPIVIASDKGSNRNLMPDSRILAMQLWKDRYLLLLTRGQKYSCYDTWNNEFTDKKIDYQHIFKLPQTNVDNRGNTVKTTPKGEVWITDKKTRKVTHLTGIYNEELLRLNSTPRYGVVTDKEGLIWISTYGNGLFAYNPKTEEMTHWLKSGDNDVPIQTNYLIYIYEDRAGNIWVSQENMGVVCISKQRTKMERRFFTTADQRDHTNSIHLLARTDKHIFVGNQYNGLKVTDGLLNNEKLIENYQDDIVAICTDQQGTVWMGTRKSGVYAGYQHYQHIDGDEHSLAAGKISSIICDKQGRVWISIFDGGVDLAVPDGKGEYTFRHFFKGKEAVYQPRQMLCDLYGDIWLCSSNGLYVFNPEQLIDRPDSYQRIAISQDGNKTDELHCIYETKSDQRILAGVQGQGMAVIDNSKQTARRLERIVSVNDGLPSNNVQQLAGDRYGQLWIGTDQGLLRYDGKQRTSDVISPSEISLGNIFVENAVCQLDDGRMAFGTHYGIVIIDPKQIMPSKSLFQLRITDVDINGITSHAEQELALDYTQNSLVFHFSDFEYTEGKRSHYSYRLKGYDKEWSEVSDQNWAAYKKLPSGKYTMEVRSYNSEDIATMDVVINPPFWATWWAYLIYIILLAIIFWTAFGYFKRVNDLRNRIKVEEQLTEYKMQFFTNISHEFRTPLTIIRGAMDRIQAIGQLPGEMKQPVSSMQKSVNRLMRMVNQLMDFSKVHEGKLRLAVQETDVVAFIRDIFSTFREMAENKHVSYQFTTTAQSFAMYVDRSFLDKIAYNLISNAFKYTPNHGSIEVKIKTSDHDVCLIVKDTGIGIEKDKQQELFARFNQSVFSKDSIGIGLHLTHELVLTHHGTITFEENPEGGSVFKVTLPTDKSLYGEQDFLPESQKLKEEEETYRHTEYKEMAGEPMNNLTALIVEDDYDVRTFLQNGLQNYFHTESANDGEEALTIIQAKRPDIIISDVMMPGMNGFELIEKIRGEKNLADIPIILLTALGDENKQVKGLKIGADAYLTKPFSLKVLVARCIQLLEQRQLLRTNYAKEVVNKSETPALIIDEQEKRLRSQLDTWLAAHLKDSDLNIDTFAQKMGYGRTTFYKKVKKLTGMTPNDYIKSLRMNRAIELLKNDTITIAQVAYEAGFEDPYYFSKSFKSYYGISPSQYRKGEKPVK